MSKLTETVITNPHQIASIIRDEAFLSSLQASLQVMGDIYESIDELQGNESFLGSYDAMKQIYQETKDEMMIKARQAISLPDGAPISITVDYGEDADLPTTMRILHEGFVRTNGPITSRVASTSRFNTELIRAAGSAVCASCFAVHDAQEILPGDTADGGKTALCPTCGVDALLPGSTPAMASLVHDEYHRPLEELA